MSWPKATVSLCYIWSQYCLPAMLGCGNHLWSIWFNVGWVVLVTGCPRHKMFVGGSLSINCWFHCSTSLISTQIQATGVAGNFWLFKENLQVTVSAYEHLLFVQIEIWNSPCPSGLFVHSFLIKSSLFTLSMAPPLMFPAQPATLSEGSCQGGAPWTLTIPKACSTPRGCPCFSLQPSQYSTWSPFPCLSPPITGEVVEKGLTAGHHLVTDVCISSF